MKLTVQLVSWNGEKYIPYLFESLRKQTYKDWKLLVLDNGSYDKTTNLIKKELNTLPVQSEVLELKENLGFSEGHNKLFLKVKTDYVLLLNQDMYLEENCLDELVHFMEEHSNFASATPLLFKWNFKELQKGELKNSFTDCVDSAGFNVHRSRKVTERFAGKQFEKIKKHFGDRKYIRVFGVSGALPIYRISALRQVAYENKIFDENFGSYKEDVDLAFRLVSCGFNSAVLLNTGAFHDRTLEAEKNLKNFLKGRKKPSVNILNSYKNHLMLLYKNEYWQNTVLDFLWIKCYEIKKAFFYLFFNPKVFFKSIKEFLHVLPKIKLEKEQMKKYRKRSWKQVRESWKL